MSFINHNTSMSTNILQDRTLREIDKICSSYICFANPKCVEIDGIYYASLLVMNYAREMEALFLDKILSLDIDVQIAMFYDKKNSYDVITELTYHIGSAGATMKTAGQNQQDIDILGNTYSDAKYIRKQLQVGEEDLFYITLYIGTYANTLEELESNLQRMESMAISIGLTTIRATYRQEGAFYSSMPFLINDEDICKMTARNILTSGLVSTYPFVSNELYDENGILIGVNSFDKSLIMLDRFDTEKYKNANMFVIGTSRFWKVLFCEVDDKSKSIFKYSTICNRS